MPWPSERPLGLPLSAWTGDSSGNTPLTQEFSFLAQDDIVEIHNSVQAIRHRRSLTPHPTPSVEEPSRPQTQRRQASVQDCHEDKEA